jgi:hypothetical protein
MTLNNTDRVELVGYLANKRVPIAGDPNGTKHALHPTEKELQWSVISQDQFKVGDPNKAHYIANGDVVHHHAANTYYLRRKDTWIGPFRSREAVETAFALVSW